MGCACPERVWSRSAQVLTAKRAWMDENVASEYMFVKDILWIIFIHYDALTKNMKDVLPLEHSVPPIVDDTVLSDIDVWQDLFSANRNF